MKFSGMFDTTSQAAALAVLAILQTAMLLAMFAGVQPHPPVDVGIFAMGPFLAVAIAVASVAVWLRTRGRGQMLAALTILLALLSFGPQKYADPAFPLIWPAVLTAQAACMLTAVGLFHDLLGRKQAAR